MKVLCDFADQAMKVECNTKPIHFHSISFPDPLQLGAGTIVLIVIGTLLTFCCILIIMVPLALLHCYCKIRYPAVFRSSSPRRGAIRP